ncbi:hypothetical protein [Xylella fastidiosa]|uniref:hypothetical protein n=1 Tax=Xylella fastidiosa TaxID=2371 RepID=UPI0004CEE08B|nr:hypothetical protein [Xylella fastidiosa]
MSVSRCLGQAVEALRDQPRAQWKAYIQTLPQVCPHTTCTAQPGCREYVAAYFRVQWGIQVNRERVQRRQAGRQHD